jgi:hypothetical protein
MITIDDLGQLADKCDNFVAGSSLPIPDEIKIEQMRKTLDEVQSKLKQYYIQITRENPWAD